MSNITVQRASDRFLTDIGWLHSRHSFNFGPHYAPEHQGHGLLVVNNDDSCGQTGFSRIFVVKATNANGYIFNSPDDPSQRDRYSIVGDFTTQPFAEQSLTKNPFSGDSGPTADQLCNTASMGVMREELKRLFPVSCRFTNATIDIKTIRSDTGMVCVAPVPQCVAPTNWKEY